MPAITSINYIRWTKANPSYYSQLQLSSQLAPTNKVYSGLDVEKIINDIKFSIQKYRIQKIIKAIDKTEKNLPGYVGGRIFKNKEKMLPIKTNFKKNIIYKEWDIKPRIEGVNRGAERVVTGNDGSVWYTNDHYKNFTKMR